jgi:hypothetical protein
MLLVISQAQDGISKVSRQRLVEPRLEVQGLDKAVKQDKETGWIVKIVVALDKFDELIELPSRFWPENAMGMFGALSIVR